MGKQQKSKSAPAVGSPTGWWNPSPYSARRRVVFHYVTKDGRTICGKWLYTGEGTVEDGMDAHDDNCADCKRRKLALTARLSREVQKMKTNSKKRRLKPVGSAVKPKYPYQTKNGARGHTWKHDEGGSLDIFAYNVGEHHNGPRCIKCNYGFCHHCKTLPEISCP
ncbi:MAG TPA: hypothetical protein VIH42_09490 [Thermoguttaceae bacterium]